MIVSEGIVFVLVWSAGMGLAMRSFRRESQTQQLQSDFIAAVTHELKTPIANIHLCLDTMERLNGESPDRLSTYIERARSSATRLNHQVDQVLSTARGAQKEVALSVFEIRPILQSVVAELKSLHTNVDFRMTVPGDLKVLALEAELRLVMSSLIDNAAKYCAYISNRPVVDIFVDEKKEISNGYLSILIRDNGSGFDEEDRSVYFKPFYRGKNAKTNAIPGTGLGLTLANKLIRQMSGKIHLLKNPKTGGAEVSVEILRPT
jgi:signal transduction histidine kinase